MAAHDTPDVDPELSALSAADLRAVLGVVHEWHQAATLDDLTRATILGVARLVDCDASGWNDLDLHTGDFEVVTNPVKYVSEEGVTTLQRLIREHPVVQRIVATGDGTAVAFSDVVSAREYHDLPLYAEVYRSIDVEDQLTISIQVDDHAIGVALNRDRRGFSRRDRAILNALRPHLRTAHAAITARSAAAERLAAFERGLERTGRWMATLRGGRIDAAGDATRQTLDRWFGGALPPLPPPGRSIRLDRRNASLVVRVVPGDPPILLLDEIRHAPDPERVRMLGLSAREAEVIAMARRGFGDGEIADALTISLRTVHKHLENAYRKLGVRTRREAADRLFSA